MAPGQNLFGCQKEPHVGLLEASEHWLSKKPWHKEKIINTESKKMAALLQTSATTESSLDSKSKPKLERKWLRILRALLNGSLNRFDAEKHGDHCLNSTVSEIGKDHLVSIDWVWEEVPAMGGRAIARVKRYWVERTEENLKLARDLLGDAAGQSITAA